ncbi:MAG: hypothetical protein IKO32_10490 [Lachnospiraceae bacterium]|nr:hypothetical protein [Lachnospiraceae bacterium]
MLINCTNHPYEIWNDAQRKAAELFGEVYDFPFPAIEPTADSSMLREIAASYAGQIEALSPAAVLVAGEYTFAFMLVDKLLSDGVKVLATCSKRITKEVIKPDGTNEKTAVFSFECFREYEYFDRGPVSGSEG